MATQTARKPRPLTLKQQAFVQERILSKSGTEAAMKAYDIPPTDKNMAAVIASQNLRKPAVAEAIAEYTAAATSEKVMSILRRKERLSSLAEPDPEHPDPVAAIKELNRMESIGLPREKGDTNVDNRTQILMAYSLEQLRALLKAMSDDEK